MEPIHTKHKILVIDDDPDLRRLVSLVLSLSGYEVVEAKNGIEGMDVFKRELPDCVLVDLMMPGMDGLRFLSWLREGAKATMPVVTMTALDDEETLRSCLKAGASRVVKKPVQVEVLEQLVKELLAVAPADIGAA
jgi:DNA-binding response OmpR family regulator